ncbi:MAG: hypothetical protein U0559_04235 [Anaerolineae bacterium]
MVTAARRFAAEIVLNPSIRLVLIAVLGLMIAPNAPIGGGGGVS